ncbi:MAG TPA: phosphoglucosamine mutase [Pyrinomonadaceae bacterium]|jgi:phosphoglucosamine mutase|nr:phosphoglucosamine mutase [Pyrinomonadaceae bacterium]
MKKLFGTDGMRGEAGRFPLDEAAVREAGRSLARHLSERLGRAPRVVTGRDTRESGGWIEAAFLEGARAAGATAESAGVITTPGVAYLARVLPADAGVVVSASHNPYHDNGIKIFSPDGRKLDDETERLIEADIHAARAAAHAPQPSSQEEDARAAAALRARYLDYLAAEVGAGLNLAGLRVVLDCANGAAHELAPALLSRLGADVIAINDAPDGRNINRDCGSLHIEGLQGRVLEVGAHLGVAFDGDADRSLYVDARGQYVDGDATLWVLAKWMQDRGELAGDRVVATVMSNLGLELALRSRGIELLRANVGDKYVLEGLLRTGASVGGEQSGHIIFPRTSLAGDGMITALGLLRVVKATGLPLHELTEGFTRYPQKLVNVPVREKLPFGEVPEIARAERETRARLGERGRLLLRYSGTEPLARVMIEGADQTEVERLAEGLAAVIRDALG